MQNEETESLARRARQGDRASLERLIEALRPGLFALAYAHLRHYEDAQDTVAAALVRALRYWHRQRDPARVNAWLRQIVRNEASRLSARRVRDGYDADLSGDGRPAPASAAASPLRADIERALRALPQDHARTLALHYLEGLPVAEIARRLGRPEGTVKFWLYRGRLALAEEMKGYAEEMPDSERWNAAVLCPDLPPELLRDMSGALKAAGWNRVVHLRTFEDAVRVPVSGSGQPLSLTPELAACHCLVLGAAVNGQSAFELLPLLNAAPERRDLALFLIAEGDAPNAEALTLAAYLSGIDMLLTRPFDVSEFGAFARRLRHPADPASNG